jgi:hypothetical protein
VYPIHIQHPHTLQVIDTLILEMRERERERRIMKMKERWAWKGSRAVCLTFRTEELPPYGAEHCWRSHQLGTHSIVSQHFIEPEGSLQHSQELSYCPYPEPDQSSPQLMYIFAI